MMSYQMKIDPKSRKAARFISLLQKKIQKALLASGKTQQEVAEILDIDRSVVNRRLKGGANLTARSIAEFAYAFDKDIVFEFVEKTKADRVNWTKASVSVNVIDLQEHMGAPSTGTIKPQDKYSLESAAS